MSTTFDPSRWTAGFQDGYDRCPARAHLADDPSYHAGRLKGVAMRTKHRLQRLQTDLELERLTTSIDLLAEPRREEHWDTDEQIAPFVFQKKPPGAGSSGVPA